MAKNYQQLAEQIIPLVGDKENIKAVRHCQTRLRFTLADESKADDKALEALDGVRKVLRSAGVYQVVIGTDVADLFAVLEPLCGLDNASDKAEDAPAEKKNPVSVIIDFVAGTFQPIIPALSGAGMLKALMALLVVFKFIDTSSQTYYIFNFFADAAFYFLPILIAFCEAKKLKCNPILAATVAGIMMHPNWISLVSAGEAVKFFEVIPFRLVNYSGTVIPIILVILVQAQVEKLLNRIIPKSVNLVFVPMLTFLVMGTLAMAVVGPIGNFLGSYLAIFFTFLSENASWAPAVLIGAFLPPMVMFGLHNGVAPLGVMQMSQLGYDSMLQHRTGHRRSGGRHPHQGPQGQAAGHFRRYHRADGHHRAGPVRRQPAQEVPPDRCHDRRRCRRPVCRSDPHPPLRHRFFRPACCAAVHR